MMGMWDASSLWGWGSTDWSDESVPDWFWGSGDASWNPLAWTMGKGKGGKGIKTSGWEKGKAGKAKGKAKGVAPAGGAAKGKRPQQSISAETEEGNEDDHPYEEEHNEDAGGDSSSHVASSFVARGGQVPVARPKAATPASPRSQAAGVQPKKAVWKAIQPKSPGTSPKIWPKKVATAIGVAASALPEIGSPASAGDVAEEESEPTATDTVATAVAGVPGAKTPRPKGGAASWWKPGPGFAKQSATTAASSGSSAAPPKVKSLAPKAMMAPKQAVKASAVTRQPHVAATSLDAARRKEDELPQSDASIVPEADGSALGDGSQQQKQQQENQISSWVPVQAKAGGVASSQPLQENDEAHAQWGAAGQESMDSGHCSASGQGWQGQQAQPASWQQAQQQQGWDGGGQEQKEWQQPTQGQEQNQNFYMDQQPDQQQEYDQQQQQPAQIQQPQEYINQEPQQQHQQFFNPQQQQQQQELPSQPGQPQQQQQQQQQQYFSQQQLHPQEAGCQHQLGFQQPSDFGQHADYLQPQPQETQQAQELQPQQDAQQDAIQEQLLQQQLYQQVHMHHPQLLQQQAAHQHELQQQLHQQQQLQQQQDQQQQQQIEQQQLLQQQHEQRLQEQQQQQRQHEQQLLLQQQEQQRQEQERQKQLLQEQQRQEQEKQKQEQERQKQLMLEKQRQEQERQNQLLLEKQRQQEQEKEKQKQLEQQEKLRQQELEKKKKQEQEEEEKQKQQELERQKQQELEKQKQLQLEKQKQQELEKQKQELKKRQQQEQQELERKEAQKQLQSNQPEAAAPLAKAAQPSTQQSPDQKVPKDPRLTTKDEQASKSAPTPSASSVIPGRSVRMLNFPRTWLQGAPASQLKARVRKLLETFGRLDGAPQIAMAGEGGASTIATATFADESGASAAIDKLHGVDNRTKQEIKASGNRRPRENECFRVEYIVPERKSSTPPSAAAATEEGSRTGAAAAAAAESAQVASGPPPGEWGAPAASASSATTTEQASTTGVLFVRGFPDSWAEQQLRVVFSIHGGLSKVQMLDPAQDAQGNKVRQAKVTLKSQGKTHQAVESLNNIEVGDGELVECCVLKVAIAEAASVPKESSTAAPAARTAAASPTTARTKRVLFFDDLPMPKRPKLAPRSTDCEIWMAGLPPQLQGLQQAKTWLQKYGDVEDIHLIRPDHGSSQPTLDKGYVRFKFHEDAKHFLKSAPQTETELKALKLSWSEAERIWAGSNNVSMYGAGILPSISELVAKEGQGHAWLLGEGRSARGGPAPDGKQLQVCMEGDEADCVRMRSELSERIAKVHDEAQHLHDLLQQLKEWHKLRKAEKAASFQAAGRAVGSKH